MKLSLLYPSFYRVKKGQTVASIADAFGVPCAVLVRENGLTAEAEEGQILLIPPPRGNRYVVKGGESKTLLCGSPQRFREINGTDCFFVGQTVYLG